MNLHFLHARLALHFFLFSVNELTLVQHSKKLLRAAIFNDTLFLQRNDVMDYSLMVAVDEARKELVVGIIDVVRTYTWVCFPRSSPQLLTDISKDKKLESWIKDRGFAGGGRNRPTVTSPKVFRYHHAHSSSSSNNLTGIQISLP